ncbi:MAG: ribosome maturation factor RimM [Bacteroidales bacterium]
MSITKEECYYLGTISKPFGYKGELVFFLDVDDPDAYLGLDSVYIEIKDRLVPFFLKGLQLRKQDLVVRIEDTTVEEAQALVGCDLYLPLENLPPLEGNKFYFHEIIGFIVIDQEKGELGPLTKIMDNGPQPILCVDCKGKEVMIPLIDNFLIELKRKERQLIVKAPEGLIDFYIESV